MFLKLDRKGTLYRQVYRALRLEILDRRLSPGARVPSTRWLASELDMSRNVVALAYSHLLAEGYLAARRGAGTYVASELPEPSFRRPIRKSTPAQRSEPRRLSGYATQIGKEWKNGVSWAPHSVSCRYDFRYGAGSLAEFPHDTWCRILARRARQSSKRDLDYGPPEGSPLLRQAICEYLSRSRGMRCRPDHVLIVAGTKQGLDLTIRVLIEDGDCVALENPHSRTARTLALAAGAEIAPIPVDDHGIQVDKLQRLAGAAKLIHVTPSYQYPTGVTMSLARRFDLLACAKRTGALIFEDDYDAGYRYRGPSIEALQALDDSGSVIYASTFSKSLFPALRLGYLVLPEDLVPIFRSAKGLMDTGSPSLLQLAVADFMREGHFERHLRKSRARNAQRRAVLLDAVHQFFGERAEVSGSNAGDHVLLWLRDIPFGSTAELVRRAESASVRVYSVRPFYISPPKQAGLLLGFASLNEHEIREGIRRLAVIGLRFAKPG